MAQVASPTTGERERSAGSGPSDGSSTRPRSIDRVGRVVAIVVNLVLLVVARNLLEWDVVPFLTDGYERVLPAITLSLVVTIIVNMLRLFRDSRAITIVTDAVATLFGLYAMVRLFQVFPFDFDDGFPWELVVRGLLIIAIVGSLISVAVAPLRLLLGDEQR